MAGKIAGSKEFPHCSEAWDAISRYIYTGLQGGSIMRGWMNDERVMIACCSDGTRPVIFKIERLDYKILYIEGTGQEDCQNSVRQALEHIDGVTEVAFRGEYIEVYLQGEVTDSALEEAVPQACGLRNGLSGRQGGVHLPQRGGSQHKDLKPEATGAFGFARCLGRFFCV